MRRTSPRVSVALSEAFRQVARLYEQIPEPYRPDVNGERWLELEREIDTRCGAGDTDGALLAIERWQEHAERVLTQALLNAPLTDRSAA